jgi:hypothetical protein
MPSLRTLVLPALAGLALVPSLVAQEASLDQIHPRRFVQFGFGVGDQDIETNSGTQIFSRSTDAFHFRLRGEYFFESEFGFFGNIYLGVADDINDGLPGSSGSSYDSFGVFVAASYRATMGESFRLPVRFGPFIQSSEEKDNATFQPDGAIERSMIGVKLSAEPEYVLWKKVEGGKVAELSAFAEFGCGAGPAEVEDDVDSEDAYAFTLGWEAGLRYRFTNGFVAGLSWFDQKSHIGTTESYNNTAFFGLDDDFTGIMITAGFRF